ncbi:MAG TPA: cytochrome P460 family protein [Pyrinomonadaceae bacterium]|nr:cytochrome P460 family protein [Pyrinomonadaceae bacterium]
MNPRIFLRLTLILTLAIIGLMIPFGRDAQPAKADNACDIAFPLPRPSEIGTKAFEKILYAFLEKRCYQNWTTDREIRNTGPVIAGNSFGTHNAVKVFYSPQAWEWLKAKNRQGEMGDGAVIVKEMFPDPAVQGSKLTGWTVMVKDKKGSLDGWYWSYHAPNYAPANPDIDYPDSGFGLYCLRCHASAEKESTFIDLRNVESDPITFRISSPPPLAGAVAMPIKNEHEQISEMNPIIPNQFAKPRTVPDPNFLKLFPGLAVVPAKDVKSFPGESLDHLVPDPGGPKGFLTSDQCLGCHGASSDNMALQYAAMGNKPINLSPYTEWRASMMGLAGRDPIFHAQLESEKTLYPSQAKFLDNTCYRCHGVMGQRQVEADKNQPFEHGMVYAKPDDPNGKYGALARDGVSCSACHRIAKDELGTPASFTGKFKVDKPDVANGPFDQPATMPMKNSLGITVQQGEQIKTSALCGSCHTVILPVFDKKGRQVRDRDGKPKEFHEQMTYPEWQNSIYQNEREPIDRAAVRTCQDCHMPAKLADLKLAFRIANIEDDTYPYTDGRLPNKDIHLQIRDPYSRHTLVGLNQFGLMFFQQFPEVLGIRTADYMFSAGVLGLLTSQKSSTELATEQTAKIAVTSLNRGAEFLEARVEVENLAGHGMPSGVAFRRAFITFEGLNEKGEVVWASGRTNSVGAIVKGATEDVLPTEFFFDPATRKQVYQPHYEIIDAENQVQIYEEIIADTEGKITTSFVGLDLALKNNRLQPKGWRVNGPYAEFTAPHGNAEHDPDYDGKNGATGVDKLIYRIPLNERTRGIVSVRAVLSYQSIPPYYLKERFSIGKGPETKRLAYLASHLTVENTPVAGWKLPLVCATRRFADSASSACRP